MEEEGRKTSEQQGEQALWLKSGSAQVLPLPRQGPGVKVSHLPPAGSHPPLNLFLYTAWFFFLHPNRDFSFPLLSQAEKGLQKLG